MNNKDFANQLAEYLFKNNDYADHIKEIVPLFLADNNLQVINTRDTLTSFCVEDVVCHYKEYKNKLSSNLTIPDDLTIEQARWILSRADYNNSDHEYGLDWGEIEEAIDEWLEENYPNYI